VFKILEKERERDRERENLSVFNVFGAHPVHTEPCNTCGPSVSYCVMFPFLQAVSLVQRRESVSMTACGLDPSGSCQTFGSLKKRNLETGLHIYVSLVGLFADLSRQVNTAMTDMVRCRYEYAL
jgi:hypothetical protein